MSNNIRHVGKPPSLSKHPNQHKSSKVLTQHKGRKHILVQEKESHSSTNNNVQDINICIVLPSLNDDEHQSTNICSSSQECLNLSSLSTSPVPPFKCLYVSLAIIL